MIFILIEQKQMVITEENGTPLLEPSLADQLEKAPSTGPSPEEVQAAQKIEGIGGTDAWDANSTKDLLDESKEIAPVMGEGEFGYAIKRYNAGFILAILGFALFAVLDYSVYLFYQYLTLKSEPSLPADKIERIQKTSDTYDEYGSALWLFNKQQYSNTSLSAWGEEAAKKILRDDQLNFVQKKDLLQVSLLKLGEEVIDLKKEIKSVKETLTKDGFFPPELVEILKADNAVGSIQRSLLSLEVVKFSSAMKVFSLMDVFVSSLAENLGYTKSDIRTKLNELMERGEKDVEYYLNVCYNNPYEPAKCDKINDFDTYYHTILQDKEFETSFFKILMEFINNKLEFSNMPSFSITFNSFNGKSNAIGFTIEVNTLKEDEYALIQQGIRSPHIFIVSELIKLLKQSTFILGKAIDAKDIKVTPKQVSIGGSKYVVNNSVKNFNLPIQKSTDREIFDFMDTYTAAIKKYQDEMLLDKEAADQTLLSGAQEGTWSAFGFLAPSEEQQLPLAQQ